MAISKEKLHAINEAACQYDSYGTITPTIEQGTITKIEIKNTIKTDDQAEGFIRFIKLISSKC